VAAAVAVAVPRLGWRTKEKKVKGKKNKKKKKKSERKFPSRLNNFEFLEVVDYISLPTWTITGRG